MGILTARDQCTFVVRVDGSIHRVRIQRSDVRRKGQFSARVTIMREGRGRGRIAIASWVK
ncbi:hypothetical protein PHLCEN_2v6937 [Hermanssonia centrifuga]|uniref:Uncharacterized protein n=1 Tax=Hermanssonia centrifuga TaxID=98765 RepID=A0A2R6NXZ1_9APHY|nr:hypothetical protein PHLCEN_2v6937 [Hermanssonia centrifuga]